MLLEGKGEDWRTVPSNVCIGKVAVKPGHERRWIHMSDGEDVSGEEEEQMEKQEGTMACKLLRHIMDRLHEIFGNVTNQILPLEIYVHRSNHPA